MVVYVNILGENYFYCISFSVVVMVVFISSAFTFGCLGVNPCSLKLTSIVSNVLVVSHSKRLVLLSSFSVKYSVTLANAL